jgi:hypothetical protein
MAEWIIVAVLLPSVIVAAGVLSVLPEIGTDDGAPGLLSSSSTSLCGLLG